MFDAALPPPEPAPPVSPPKDQADPAAAAAQPASPPTSPPEPPRKARDIPRVLTLVHWLIDYALNLTVALQRQAARGEARHYLRRYRNPNLTIILHRIRRGLRLARGLEQYLEDRIAKGRGIPDAPLRNPRDGCSGTGQAAGMPKTRRAPRATNIIDFEMDRLPTAQEIADELSRRPVGAVLVDICREFGIYLNDLPADLQETLRDTMLFCGGSLRILLFGEQDERLREHRAKAKAGLPDPLWEAYTAPFTAPCTGPP